MTEDNLSGASVIVICVFHHLTLKRSVSLVWKEDPEKRLGLHVPFGCKLDQLQVEAQKALRELSNVTAKIAVDLP